MKTKFQVFRNDKACRESKPIAEFYTRSAAIAFIQTNYPVVTDPFSKASSDHVVRLDIRFNSFHCALLSPVLDNLKSNEYYKELAEDGWHISKEDVVNSLFYHKDAGDWDYALPAPHMDFIVEKALMLDKYADYEKYELFRILHGGLIWFYPRDGYGRINGRPAALTADAEKLVLDVYGAQNDN